MKIALANDPAAKEIKPEIIRHLNERGCEVVDLGWNSDKDTRDYPVYGERIGRYVAEGKAPLGIAICGTGVGIGIAANKVKGIRACICSDPYTSKLSRQHNASNILAFGARVVGVELAKMIIDAWLDAEPLDVARHKRRVEMIGEIEERFGKDAG